MNKEKIAILVDSCCDVSKEMVDKYGMYVVPLRIIYREKEYLDGIDITADEVYNNLSVEIPKTSLPSGELIHDIFKKIKADGYDKVIGVSISSGLSGTFNILNLLSNDVDYLEFEFIDTKNIAIGAGFSAILAGMLIDEGKEFHEIANILRERVLKSKVFFCVNTLEYLQKGGRIGLVASLFGNALNLKPIISCNEDGIYYTVAKVRGRKPSINKVMELATKFVGDSKRYNLTVSDGFAHEEIVEVSKKMKEALPNYVFYGDGQISPALGVHTGPGLIGVCIQILD
ncbi:MAG: DegV family protein [Erysipelotrichaceae bacterium]